MKQSAHDAGFNAERLAERLDVSASAVWAWWGGRNEPDMEMLRRYADTVGRSVDWLAGGEDFADVVVRFVERVMGGDAPGEAVTALGLELPPEVRRELNQWAVQVRRYIQRHAPAAWHTLAPDQQRRFVQALLAADPPGV